MLQGINVVHPDWRPLIEKSLSAMDQSYLLQLENVNNIWLPGKERIFNAFSIPLSETRYILMGESPYPRAASANGYAFWDAAVHPIWSDKGFSTAVNRATSLRNFLKMLLLANGQLTNDFSQAAISNTDKSHLVVTADELFKNLLNHGFCLLNASLVLSKTPVPAEARAWQPFMQQLLQQLHQIKPSLKLILFGKIANQFKHMDIPQFETLIAEHPYNISFITNQDVVNFFKPLKLLNK